MTYNLKMTVVKYKRANSDRAKLSCLTGHWSASAVKRWSARYGFNLIGASHTVDYGVGGKSWQRGSEKQTLNLDAQEGLN